MKYSYWNELSGGSRLAKDGAKSVKKGVEIFNVSNERFIKAAESLKQGAEFPYMIFITTEPPSNIVVLEGHLRITAHFLVPESLEKGLEVILGTSKNMSKWDSY